MLLQALRTLRNRGVHLDASTVAAVANGITRRARQGRGTAGEYSLSWARNWLCAHALKNL